MGIKSGLERKLASYRESPRELILDVADYFTGYRGIAELVSNYRKYPKLSDTNLCKLNSTWSTIITAVEVVAIATIRRNLDTYWLQEKF